MYINSPELQVSSENAQVTGLVKQLSLPSQRSTSRIWHCSGTLDLPGTRNCQEGLSLETNTFCLLTGASVVPSSLRSIAKPAGDTTYHTVDVQWKAGMEMLSFCFLTKLFLESYCAPGDCHSDDKGL